MIRYALICNKKHEFEIWFSDSSDYDKQRKRGLVECPACGSPKVEKAMMAPSISATRKQTVPITNDAALPAPSPEAPEPVTMMSPQEMEFRTKLKELREHMVKNADNVGKKFPDEARKMHYGEIEHRSIYGEASPDDAKALIEEGVEFHPLPVLPGDKN